MLGAFKRADGSFDLKYELAPLGEQFNTPGDEDAARKANRVLPLLDDYAGRGKGGNLLAKFPEGTHPAQAKNPKLNMVFVGSESCAKCHAAESAKWKETAHSHAFDALEKVAKRPAQRQFDGECASAAQSDWGTRPATGTRWKHRTKHVGCESCHGPGRARGRLEDPRYLSLQSPWRVEKPIAYPISPHSRSWPSSPRPSARKPRSRRRNGG